MMIILKEIAENEEESIVLNTHNITPELLRIISQLKLFQTGIVGYKGNEVHRLNLPDIFYFEIVDNNALIKTEGEYYDSNLKLYEFENLVGGTSFFKASKNLVLNASYISYIAPSLSGRFIAHLENGEEVEVSRQYVPVLKEKFGLPKKNAEDCVFSSLKLSAGNSQKCKTLVS